jgi:hypothetical protein
VDQVSFFVGDRGGDARDLDARLERTIGSAAGGGCGGVCCASSVAAPATVAIRRASRTNLARTRSS